MNSSDWRTRNGSSSPGRSGSNYGVNGFGTNAYRPQAKPLSSNKTNGASKERPVYLEVFLKNVQFEDYEESIDHPDDFSHLKWRWRFLDESCSIFVNSNNGKIYIPLDVLDAIVKVDDQTVILELMPGARTKISYESRLGIDEKDPIRVNLDKAKCIKLVAHDRNSTNVFDMIGLHIQYLLNKRNNQNGDQSSRGTASSWGQLQGAATAQTSLPDHNGILKCHLNQETRLVQFNTSMVFDELRQHMQQQLGVPYISKLVYKDETGDLISIVNHMDYMTAQKFYMRDSRFEVWVETGAPRMAELDDFFGTSN